MGHLEVEEPGANGTRLQDQLQHVAVVQAGEPDGLHWRRLRPHSASTGWVIQRGNPGRGWPLSSVARRQSNEMFRRYHDTARFVVGCTHVLGKACAQWPKRRAQQQQFQACSDKTEWRNLGNATVPRDASYNLAISLENASQHWMHVVLGAKEDSKADKQKGVNIHKMKNVHGAHFEAAVADGTVWQEEDGLWYDNSKIRVQKQSKQELIALETSGSCSGQEAIKILEHIEVYQKGLHQVGRNTCQSSLLPCRSTCLPAP